jgi:Tol biopolymer transport system component
MSRALRIRASLFLVALCMNGCGNSSSTAPSAQRVPINTATGWSDSPFISGDGKRLYFMYSRYDFGPFILSGGTRSPVLSGPDRPGLHHSSNPFDESDIYVATKNADGSWSEPVNLGLNGAYGDASGMEVGGPNAFVWLQGNGTTNNIVTANRNTDGTWGATTDLGPGINDHSAGVIQDNPHMSADGTALWFTSSRPTGSVGGKDIWFSSRSGAVWSVPVNIGTPFNTAGDEDQFFFANGTLDLYWNGPSGINHCVSNGSTCSSAPDVVTIPGCSIAAEVSITDDGQLMYFGCGDPTTGRVKIMFSRRQPGGWGAATPVD